jgi:hypothetical protein
VAGMVPAPAGRSVGHRLYNSKCREEVNPGSARESEAALERHSLPPVAALADRDPFPMAVPPMRHMGQALSL